MGASVSSEVFQQRESSFLFSLKNESENIYITGFKCSKQIPTNCIIQAIFMVSTI